MPKNKWFVVMFVFLFAVLSAGMLQAQSANVSGHIPEYVYSTEVVPSDFAGEYAVTVTAVFPVNSSTTKWTKELTLEKYSGGQWHSGHYTTTATFGQGVGYTYQWGMTGKAPVARYPYLRPGVYRLVDGTTTAVVVVGTPTANEMPDLSKKSRFLYAYIAGEQLRVTTENRHPSYVMMWQNLGDRVALGFSAISTEPIGTLTVGETRFFQSQPMNVVVCDVTGGCATTQVPVRDPFSGQGAKK
jgi:hypothetical protein